MRHISSFLWLSLVASVLLWPLRLGGWTKSPVPRPVFDSVGELRLPAVPAVQSVRLVTDAPTRAERRQYLPLILAVPGREALHLQDGQVIRGLALAVPEHITTRNVLAYFPTGPPPLA